MDSDRVLRDQTVVVRGSHIVALGPVARVHVPTGAVRIDGHGQFLIPGLADMHTHLQFMDSVGDAALLLHKLAHGVTTVRGVDFADHAGGMDFDLHGGRLLRLRARAASGAILSPRIYTSGPWAGAKVGRPEDAAADIPAYKAAGYDFIKIHDEDRATFEAVAAVARRIGMPIVGHVPPGVSLPEALRTYRSIEHLYDYPPPAVVDTLAAMKAKHVNVQTFLDTAAEIPGLPAVARATQRAGVWNCPTQALADWLAARGLMMSTGVDLDGIDAHGFQQLRRRTIRALQAAGAGLLLGTDAGVGRGSLPFVGRLYTPTVQDELAALVAAGLTPYQALRTGTWNVAVYFGTQAQSGTIAVGKQADLVLLTANPLADIHNAGRIAGVVLHGRWFSMADLDHRMAAMPPVPFVAGGA